MIIGMVVIEVGQHSGTYDYTLQFSKEEHEHLIELSRRLKDPYNIKNVLRKTIETGLKQVELCIEFDKAVAPCENTKRDEEHPKKEELD